MNVSGIIGLCMAMAITIASAFLGAGHLFVCPPALLGVLVLALGLSLISTGGKDLFRAIFSLRVIFRKPRDADYTRRNRSVLKELIIHSYVSGVLMTLIGWIQLLGDYDPSRVTLGMALSLLTIFYALIIAEVLIRPVIGRLEKASDAMGSKTE